MPERWRVCLRGKFMCSGLISGLFACVFHVIQVNA